MKNIKVTTETGLVFLLSKNQMREDVVVNPYRMNRIQMKKVFKRKRCEVMYWIGDCPVPTGFTAWGRLKLSGYITIGCQIFPPAQVRKLRKWAMGEK